MDDMERKVLQKKLKALAGESRLAILAELRRRGRASVSVIAHAIDRSMTTASIHLAHLERQGIIERRQRVREVFYRLSIPQD